MAHKWCASGLLFIAWLVIGWSTSNSAENPSINQFLTIIAVGARRNLRQTRAMQRTE